MYEPKRFEVGKSYEPWGLPLYHLPPVTVVRRTDKTVWVTDGDIEWRMRIRHTICGDETAVQDFGCAVLTYRAAD